MIRIGTRGSALALAQAHLVAGALAQRGIAHEIVTIETAGDKRAANTPWGEGAFVTAIESALVERRIDAAVHSAKDVPTSEDPRLTIAAFLPRDEPRDALVLPAGRSGTLATLPAGTVIGTDSPRRTAFLRAYRSDLEVRPLHGNVDTRLRKLDEGEVDALLLAAAGLNRLGRGARITWLVPEEIVPPAPGQGAIAVQVRGSDAPTRAAVTSIDDRQTRCAVEAERELLRATGGGCRAPIGALAKIDGDRIQLRAAFATLDGRATGFDSGSGWIGDRIEIATDLAATLVDKRANIPGAPRVLVTRPVVESRRLAARLAEHGVAPVIVPAIEIEILPVSDSLNEALADLSRFNWIVFTSANGARAFADAARASGANMAGTRLAAVGMATARELFAAGADDVWLPSEANAHSLGRTMPLADASHVLWIRGELADRGLIEALTSRSATVTDVVAYRTREGPDSSRALLHDALDEQPLDAVVFASPSAVDGLLALAGTARREQLLAIPAVCVGGRTSDSARAAGFEIAAVAPTPDIDVLAELAAEAAGINRSRNATGVPA